ncbi:hypothetical protein V8F44DRAFT_318408 [Aspergillus fumigatus]
MPTLSARIISSVSGALFFEYASLSDSFLGRVCAFALVRRGSRLHFSTQVGVFAIFHFSMMIPFCVLSAVSGTVGFIHSLLRMSGLAFPLFVFCSLRQDPRHRHQLPSYR